jgi:hypothetical protein
MIAIDPGASGAIAFTNKGHVFTYPMPETLDCLWLLLSRLYRSCSECWLEDVGTYMPGNSGPASVKFARHIGQIEGILVAQGWDVYYVRPQVWMKDLGYSINKHLPEGYSGLGKEDRAKARAAAKRANKNEIKKDMSKLYSEVEVTLANADALAILAYANKHG